MIRIMLFLACMSPARAARPLLSLDLVPVLMCRSSTVFGDSRSSARRHSTTSCTARRWRHRGPRALPAASDNAIAIGDDSFDSSELTGDGSDAARTTARSHEVEGRDRGLASDASCGPCGGHFSAVRRGADGAE
eukprot:CAMPEP_0115886336 /NCGR_PEP_ID=MMETSP0287-20121206/31152_1 /TAXON_ID=412157 /ORGANISM="Chrysochromulina rotalis, Strain UIO044" /LENGTH=133 /DNA_ID=CAMNT_0003342811 /DNA_START=555 /DNA_END=956 /DNA_ORIENTATION=+